MHMNRIIDRVMTQEGQALTTNQIIDQVLAQQIGATPDIYTVKRNDPGYDYVPHSVYFFYIRINNSGQLAVDHYFYFRGPPDDPTQWEEIPYEDVDDIVRTLALNARPTGAGNPAPLPAHNFENILLRRKCYVAFYVDEEHWLFHKRDDGNNAMVFSEVKTNVTNYSFFDAKDIDIQMPRFNGGTDTRRGVFLINHMKRDAAGNDLVEGDVVPFAFDMYFGVHFANPTTKTLTVIFDPGGTNQGPPEKP